MKFLLLTCDTDCLAHQVFEPQSTQADVFEDISQLAQSCTDGYNVCVFAYGQTGSGKSFTMEGGSVGHYIDISVMHSLQASRLAILD